MTACAVPAALSKTTLGWKNGRRRHGWPRTDKKTGVWFYLSRVGMAVLEEMAVLDDLVVPLLRQRVSYSVRTHELRLGCCLLLRFI
ncbi:hypothetical protein EYF80_010807 [Liparis tanakae]|uniref:Uncharacterized protein n=1 Tax=Liparis tanakae TaxID=230148 RepID=A0A4Z2IM71_9TELE|nr:hypothetical protein EYF80_010807 [Liparis tanakae]